MHKGRKASLAVVLNLISRFELLLQGLFLAAAADAVEEFLRLSLLLRARALCSFRRKTILQRYLAHSGQHRHDVLALKAAG